MKKFLKFRDALTIKQARKLSVICSLISVLVISTLFTLIVFGIHLTSLIPFTLFFICSFPFIIDIFYIVFDGPYKEKTAEGKAADQVIISKFNLTTTDYTEVRYKYEKAIKETVEAKLFMTILTNSACRFLVKLTEDEKIDVVVKDKDKNIIYIEILDDFDYFKNHFEIK